MTRKNNNISLPAYLFTSKDLIVFGLRVRIAQKNQKAEGGPIDPQLNIARESLANAFARVHCLEDITDYVDSSSTTA